MKAFTVALVGADGAGKSTVSERLQDHLSRPVRCLYMGINPESARHILPTTRIVRAVRRRRRPAAAVRSTRNNCSQRAAPESYLSKLRSLLRLMNMLAEESYRQLLAWWHMRRGRIVVFDRHFLFDYYATDVSAPQTLPQKLHGLFLYRLYPRPDLVIYLDAPPEVMLARKGEGTIESLSQKRGEYLAFGDMVPRFEVVDSSRPLEEVVREVAMHIEDCARTFPGGGNS